MKKKEKGKFTFSLMNSIVLGILFLSIAVFLGLIINLNILPVRYLVILIGVFVIIFGLFLLGLRSRKTADRRKESVGKKIGKILSLLLSLCLVFISYKYIAEGTSFLSKITGSNFETHVVTAYVLADNPTETIADVKDGSFGTTQQGITDYLTDAITDINEKVNQTVSVAEYNDFESLTNALYNGEVDVLLMNDANLGFAELFRENFETETKAIYHYEVKTETDVETSDKSVTKDVFTVYISGIDTYGSVSKVSRSDVNLLLTINPTTKQILMVSIPRDYYVELGTKGAKDKLTHSGNFGINETILTVEKLLTDGEGVSIDIDYYIRVNFTSVTEVVDALGGVTVNWPRDYSFTTRHGGYTINPGNNTLNGDQALGFVRERYSLKGGDNERVLNQQRLLMAILRKAMSPAIITNWSSILNSVSDSIEMSFSSSDVTSLIQMQLNDGADWDFQSYALTGSGTYSTNTYSMPGSNLYVMIPNEDTVNQAIQYIKAMQAGETIEIAE